MQRTNQSVFTIRRKRIASGVIFLSIALSAYAMLPAGLSTPASAAMTAHAPILITSDSEFTLTNGVIGGDGSQGNPHVISGWEILTDSSTGIEIRGTSAYFTIENCSVHGSLLHTGILLNNSANGVVRNVSSTMNLEGLVAMNSSDMLIADCNMSANENCGIDLINPHAVAVSNCTITDIAYDNLGAIQIDGLSTEVRVENNTIAVAKGSGIRVDGSINGSSIANNSIADCDVDGIMGSDMENTSLMDNEITSCSQHGIWIGGDEDNQVVRNTVSNSRRGILCYAPGTTIEWNMIENSSLDAGINCWSSGNTIANNTVTDCKYWGLTIPMYSSDNVISDNTFVGDGVSMSLYAWGNRFVSNTVNGLPLVYLEGVHGYTVGSAGQVIAVDSTDITVRDMDLSYSTMGVELLNCSDCLIDNVTVEGDYVGLYVSNGSNRNEIVDCRIADSYWGVVIELMSNNNSVRQCSITGFTEGLASSDWSSDNEFVGNDISRCGPGPSAVAIHASNTPRITIDSNRIRDTIDGIEVFPARDYTVTNNTIVNSTGRGIFLRNDCENGLIENNTLRDCGYGIAMSQQLIHEGPNKNLVTGNLIENASVEGISLIASFRNTISENIVRNCSLGIHLIDTGQNHIFLNRFENNAVNALSEYTEGENYWNTSEPVEYEYDGHTYVNYLGNYWDDYAGADSNGDGIGETPYQVGDGYDNYPLSSGVSDIPELQSVWVAAAALMGVVLIAAGIQRRRTRQ